LSNCFYGSPPTEPEHLGLRCTPLGGSSKPKKHSSVHKVSKKQPHKSENWTPVQNRSMVVIERLSRRSTAWRKTSLTHLSNCPTFSKTKRTRDRICLLLRKQVVRESWTLGHERVFLVARRAPPLVNALKPPRAPFPARCPVFCSDLHVFGHSGHFAGKHQGETGSRGRGTSQKRMTRRPQVFLCGWIA
jgi:hypothetical protein